MNLLGIFDGLKASMNKAKFKLDKVSPEVFIIVGTIGVIGTVVAACVATTKVSAVTADAKEQLDAVHNMTPERKIDLDYTPEDEKKDLAIIYIQTGFKYVKLYAPSVVLGALSIGLFWKSNNILKTRNAGLTAAYFTVSEGFKKYRGRVVDRYGAEIENEIRYDIKAQKVERIIVDEDGKEKKVKETVKVYGDPSCFSIYERVFDEGNLNYKKTYDSNHIFLRCAQAQANDLLRQQGYLFLNDVFRILGFKVTDYGQVVGWVYGADNARGNNFVDFGIGVNNIDDPVVRAFTNGDERSALLSFNVDGVVYDLLDKYAKEDGAI